MYIKTPRATVALDLSTINLKNHDKVKDILKRVFDNIANIKMEIKSFKEVEIKGQIGASVVIKYETEDGAKNQFKIDIVYA